MKLSDISIQELIIARLTGISTQEEDLKLDRLIREDPAIATLWNTSLQQHSSTNIEIAYKRYDAAWIDGLTITHKNRKAMRSTATWNAAAAAIVIISLGIWSLKSQPPVMIAANHSNKKEITLQSATGKTISLSGQQENFVLTGTHISNTNKTLRYNTTTNSSAAVNILSVPTGMDYHIVLSDSSEIWLNAASELRFPFTFAGGNREITINGEAYMKIAKDPSHPFLVHTPQGCIQILGTAFNINTYNTGKEKLALIQGAVRFQAGNKEVLLQPGKELVYSTDKGMQLQSFDEDITLSWLKGQYTFEDATLQDITSVLPRWYGIDVVMDSPALTQVRFTGIMNRNVPVTVFLNNISFAMKIKYYFDKDGTLHFK